MSSVTAQRGGGVGGRGVAAAVRLPRRPLRGIEESEGARGAGARNAGSLLSDSNRNGT